MTKRNCIKYAIITALVLFTPVLAYVRYLYKDWGNYRWVDQPGKRILIPDEVQGQLGFKATVSEDGQILAVAGNPVMQAGLHSGDIKSIPNGEYLFFLALRTQFYVAEAPFTHFRHLWSDKNTSFTTAIAISSGPNYQLAVLVYEFPFEHPDSIEDAAKIYGKDDKKRSQYAEKIKDVFDQGYEESIYLIDLNTGNRKKLATVTNRQSKNNFARLFNEKALSWNSTGSLLFTHDMENVFAIDLSGNRKNLFHLKNCAVFSSIYCESNDNISFVVIEKGQGNPESMSYDGPAFLVQIDANGHILKKEPFLCPPTYNYEENNITFISKDNLLFPILVGEKSKKKLDSKLCVVTRIPDVPQALPESKGKFVLFHDPNEVHFYYTVCGLLPDTNEVLFAKKRLLTTKASSTYDLTNANAPWVELRRLPLNTR